MNLDISIPQIWQRVGIRRWTEHLKAKSLGRSLGPGLALVLYWPLFNGYLRVMASRIVVDDQGAKQKVHFSGDKEGASELLMSYGFSRGRIPSAIEKGRSHILFAEVKSDDVLVIDFEVDTNNQDFLREASQLNGQDLIKQIEVQVVARDESGKSRDDAGVIDVHLTPARAMERYDGYVASDLGNTSSTLVCLDASRGATLAT